MDLDFKCATLKTDFIHSRRGVLQIVPHQPPFQPPKLLNLPSAASSYHGCFPLLSFPA